jgi:L-ascorbate metabolism protein UlaG (beta-lactamase superfamily)
MQIKYLGGKKFDIKLKDLEIKLNGDITINDFTFPGAGEYEKGGVILNGISDKDDNTIYVLKAEDMILCYLNNIKNELSEEEVKSVGNVDILFVPLGEENTVDAKVALKLISKIDPKIVIPMLYTDLTEFKKSEAVEEGETDTLKIKKADLPEEERKVYILKNS